MRKSSPENAAAEEFRFLDRVVEANAREVFEDVGVAEAVDAADADAVLVLGPEPVYVGTESLTLMRRALESGASEVRPFRFADTELAERGPVRTLSDYERLERVFISETETDSETQRGPADATQSDRDPIALLTAERFREDGLESDASNVRRDGVAFRGLCYVFIDYFGEIRTDIAHLLPETVERVLEIGCGRGATGQYLKKRFGCSVTGVELNPLVAAEAERRLDRVVVEDAENVSFDENFDVVLALDVVEHLARPEALLSRLPSWLRPDGRAILSIPNVGHHAIVRDLLEGRWDYVPIGLLCYTHLRFFTRSALEALCRRAKLEQFEILPRKSEPPEWLVAIEERLSIDRESLETEGFYVIIRGGPVVSS